jgi:hypothetical protein
MSPDPKSKKSVAQSSKPSRALVATPTSFKSVDRPVGGTTELTEVHDAVLKTLGTQSAIEVPLNGLKMLQVFRKIKTPLTKAGKLAGLTLRKSESVDVLRLWVTEKKPKGEPKAKKVKAVAA